MAIYQADQYMIPFTIRNDKNTVTPENSSDVAIVLGHLIKRYSDNALLFVDGEWLFPLTREDTIKMTDRAKCQIEVRYGNNIVHSKPFDVKVKPSLMPFLRG